jgi:hypothetical protein
VKDPTIEQLRDEHSLRVSMMNRPSESRPFTTSQPCALLANHSPGVDYCEVHHLIPRAWQQFWKPAPPWKYPATYDGQKLWDGREIPLCRTHHGNVHYVLVAIMQAYGGNGGDLDKAITTARWQIHALDLPFGVNEVNVATEGMARFTGTGGDLMALCGKGLYGYI